MGNKEKAEGRVDQLTEAKSSEEAIESAELEGIDVPIDKSIEIPETGSPNQVIEELKEYFKDTEEAYPWGNPSEDFLEEDFFDFSYLDDHEEVERYWLNKPYAYVSILRDEDKHDDIYYVVEPNLDEFEEYVSDDLLEMLRDVITYIDVPEGEDRSEEFKRVSEELISEYSGGMSDGSLHKIYYYLRRDFSGYGKIDPFMHDRNVEDISCNGTGVSVYVYHRNYRDLITNVAFEKESNLNSFVVRLAQKSGRHVSVSNPLVDASLPDGSRIQLTFGTDISTRGSNFTIRRLSDVPITRVDLIRWNTFSLEEMAYFWLCIEKNKSLIFAGGTASGKTTSMNAVSFFIPPKSKVVSIEDTREITLPHDNWISNVTRQPFVSGDRGGVDMYDLLQSSLRQRPEHILVGEIRADPEVALTFFQAMGTGHTAYTTFHADSIDSLIDRLENEPLNVPRRMLQALDTVCVQKQIVYGGKRVRRSSEIVELPDEGDPDTIKTNKVFGWDSTTDGHRKTGKSSLLESIRVSNGWTESRLEKELQRRKDVLEYLIEEDITDHEEVGKTIHMFWHDQDWVMKKVQNGSLDSDSIDEAIKDLEVAS
jgi:flagellar protein FlaI